jgi:dienelactone hydrolase
MFKQFSILIPVSHSASNRWFSLAGFLAVCFTTGYATGQNTPAVVPAGKPLTLQGDPASQMVAGIDRFLLRKLAEAAERRDLHWQRDFESVDAFRQSIAENRGRLVEILGAADRRIAPREAIVSAPILADIDDGSGGFRVEHLRLPVLPDPDPNRSIASVDCEALLLTPRDIGSIRADVIAVPDCDQTPAQIAGFVDGLDRRLQFARTLAGHGCRVLVPMLVDRQLKPRGGRANVTNREFVYRSSFELGRHVIGYEVQKLRSAIGWLRATAEQHDETRPLGMMGAGEGARLALFTAALDDRIDALCLAGDFGNGESLWQQPTDRNVFGLLQRFGDAELLTMTLPTPVLINHCEVAETVLTGEGGGAPGSLSSVPRDVAEREVERARKLAAPLVSRGAWEVSEVAGESPCEPATVNVFLEQLTGQQLGEPRVTGFADSISIDEDAMQQRCIEQLDRHTQLLLRESPFVRDEFMRGLKFDSLAEYERSAEPYRKRFHEDVIGKFDDPLLQANPRLRQTWRGDGWTGYEVALDVFPDVIAYGALLLPDDLQPGRRRPVVVCQHGLEGRPTDTFLDNHRAYHDYAAKLAQRGFIVFAPQNPYIFKDRFRTLQRKANPLGKTLFSVIIAQHQQIVRWLKGQPFVDPQRIGFYGLSYGGKSAMRIPAVVTDYCLSICSADFNEWVRKNASTRHRFSYVWTGEYEIFEWNLGGTFNYAEMAALICPRPFMVERGHFDGVGTDQWVAYEYAKVRNLYAARLKIPERTEIEWFDGPHMINGEGTFEFLHRHLNWPK